MTRESPVRGFSIRVAGKSPHLCSQAQGSGVDTVSVIDEEFRAKNPEQYADLFSAEEAEANAKLIAAAPDLLTALLEVEAHHVAQNRLKGRDEQRSTTLRIVRAAIAKATGEAMS